MDKLKLSDKEIKYCIDCKYFCPYFVKDKNGQYYYAKTGHCNCDYVQRMTFKSCLNYGIPCGRWEKGNPFEEDEQLYDIVKKTAARIEQIAAELNIK